MVEQHPTWDAHVVYGDTDSLFVQLPGRSALAQNPHFHPQQASWCMLLILRQVWRVAAAAVRNTAG